MREWSNPYNSFNSYKGLLYKQQFDGISSKKLLPPIEVNIDPSNNCQLYCKWCNGSNIINRKDHVAFTKDHLMNTIKYLKEWGVKAICFAGGGEPTLHPDLAEAMRLTKSLGMEVALISNGLFLNEDQIKAAAETCRWIGISVDAVESQTYKYLKGADCLDTVLTNIGKLVANGANEVTYKYLVHPLNQKEIYKACEMARDLGCQTFHSRILSSRYLKSSDEFIYEEINKQLEDCMRLDSDTFKVMAIRHKQQGEGNRRIKFSKCKVSPLLCMLEANGDVSICIDRKGDPKTRLCSHLDLDELKHFWGSKRHFDMMDSINPEIDCPKCTLCIYNELFEAVEQDKFCSNFP